MKITMTISDNSEFFADVADGATVELSSDDIVIIKNLAEVCKVHNLYRVSKFGNPLQFFVIDWETEEHTEFPGRVECVSLNVTTDNFFWSGYYKHTSVRWETTSIPLVDLESGEDLDFTEKEQRQ